MSKALCGICYDRTSKLECYKLVALDLKPLDDLAYKASLYAVWLDHYVSLLHCAVR
jgi:hypothetical protein